jgi:hypothetical protein
MPGALLYNGLKQVGIHVDNVTMWSVLEINPTNAVRVIEVVLDSP